MMATVTQTKDGTTVNGKRLRRTAKPPMEKHRRRVPPGVCAVFFKSAGDSVEVSMMPPAGFKRHDKPPDHVLLAAEAMKHCMELMGMEDPCEESGEEAEPSAVGLPGSEVLDQGPAPEPPPVCAKAGATSA